MLWDSVDSSGLVGDFQALYKGIRIDFVLEKTHSFICTICSITSAIATQPAAMMGAQSDQHLLKYICPFGAQLEVR